jgi:solute carrier family 30 (zinc transporter), member 5/7
MFKFLLQSFLKYVSFIGLCVNLFGIFAFSHAHSHGGVVHDSPSHNHSHSTGSTHSHSHSSCQSNSSLTSDNDNMRGVYLHVLADTLGSVGVIISSFLMQQFGLYIADPICSICIASMIFVSVIPLLKHSSSLLILRTPFSKEIQFENLLKRILNIEGVISYRDDHLWQLSSGSSYIATIHVQITSNSYEQLISAQINGLLKELKLTNLTVQLEKEVFFQHLIGLGANMGQMSDSNRVYKNQNTIDSNALINVEKYV